MALWGISEVWCFGILPGQEGSEEVDTLPVHSAVPHRILASFCAEEMRKESSGARRILRGRV